MKCPHCWKLTLPEAPDASVKKANLTLNHTVMNVAAILARLTFQASCIFGCTLLSDVTVLILPLTALIGYVWTEA